MVPKVIVLILSYNGKHLLDDCIKSYADNNYGNYQLVVIDNGSTDGTQSYVESIFPAIKVLRTNINLNYSGGLNFGLKYAFKEELADFVLITNNDVVADKNIITSLVETAIAIKDSGFVIGKVYFYEQPDTFQTVGKKYDPILWNGGHIGNREKDIGQYEIVAERAWCDDIYWLVKRELYEKTGGYDIEFAFQGEDFDWQVRAKQAGYKIIYTPYAKLWHKESMTIGKNSRFKTYYDARNPLIVHMKYRTQGEFRKYFYVRLKSILIGSFKQLIRLKFKHILANFFGIVSAIHWGIRNNKLSVRHFI